MPLQLDDLAALDAPTPAASGLPLMLAIEDIDEDPDQPRREFDEEALRELADTIRERGVRQPVSVRPNPQQPGRWILNFGARRLRAARLVGLTQIPAFVDPSADSYDQVIENEQREGLRPLELALFVQKRLALGESKSEIARKLGKSKQWMTLATALIEAPQWLLDVYRQGRCSGMNELHELRRLHDERPEAVENWATQHDLMTRDRIAAFKRTLPDSKQLFTLDQQSQDASRADVHGASSPESPSPVIRRLCVELDGQDYELIVSSAPPESGAMYIRPLSGGPRRSTPVCALRLRGFVGS